MQNDTLKILDKSLKLQLDKMVSMEIFYHFSQISSAGGAVTVWVKLGMLSPLWQEIIWNINMQHPPVSSDHSYIGRGGYQCSQVLEVFLYSRADDQ